MFNNENKNSYEITGSAKSSDLSDDVDFKFISKSVSIADTLNHFKHHENHRKSATSTGKHGTSDSIANTIQLSIIDDLKVISVSHGNS